jgi:hypothetical protein
LRKLFYTHGTVSHHAMVFVCFNTWF